jgi:hypothetical protein
MGPETRGPPGFQKGSGIWAALARGFPGEAVRIDPNCTGQSLQDRVFVDQLMKGFSSGLRFRRSHQGFVVSWLSQSSVTAVASSSCCIGGIECR